MQISKRVEFDYDSYVSNTVTDCFPFTAASTTQPIDNVIAKEEYDYEPAQWSLLRTTASVWARSIP